MAKSKSPYSFPARSRAAMIAAIEAIANPRSYDHRRWPFTWNVKLPYVPDLYTAERLNPEHYEGGTFDPSLDSAWEAEMQGESFDYHLIEDMRRQVEDYTDYDGNDSFKFHFNGRQGGWLVLEEAFGIKFADFDLSELSEGRTYDGYPFRFETIRQLYRALTVMDHDFRPEAVRAEMIHQVAFMRLQWEEDRQAEREAANEALAAELEGSRPDMYQPA